MKSPQSGYRSYLLRIWSAGEEEGWRAMLECVNSHKRHCFGNLESLFNFLEQEVSLNTEPGREVETGDL